ncbi:hypothetical protein GOP47_0017777 [Adiantum capillus-veneris]|uniref:RRM domain-containing protein n=1 Tax=Adiantum capillus-veneris TaxID=13818 RepID=A0A9D4UG18_ADICA|nr:hypothetical protein GOP47_0017777 [Adiantum capillus-veneris]
MNPLREIGRTFTLNMGSDGAASLQKVILKKLTEFMGDYSDDVLAQYILVLVAHGKQQAQAVKDLEAFLGDRSESFVAWLWDYLCSNLHLHASVSKAPVLGGNGVEHKVEQADSGRVKLVQADVQVSSLGNKHGEKRLHTSNNARNIPDLNDSPPKVGNMEIGSESEKVGAKDRIAGKHSQHSVKQLHSFHDTQIRIERERRSDVKHHRKRHASPVCANATRRLLQSAVREAVGPVTGLLKSGSKRLRSVVSTEVDELEDTRAYKNVVKADDVEDEKIALPALPVCAKGVAPTEQNDNGGFIGSVWDRLGRTTKCRKDEGIQGDMDSTRIWERRFMSEDTYMDEDEDGRKLPVHQSRLSDLDLNERNGHATEKSIAERPDSFHQDRPRRVHVKEANVLNHTRFQHFRGNDNQEMVVGVPRSVDKESKRVLYANGPVRIVDTEIRGAQHESLATPSSRQFDSSEKHVVCSQGQQPGSSHMEQLQTQLARPEDDSHKNVLELKKRLDQIQMEMMKLRAKQFDSNKEMQNANSSILPGTDEVLKMQDSLQSRTVFVANIHFAASKEAIMAHFVQCGKVEQVVVLTDAATGKPKGSAYVEFSAKAEAEKALTLNETSFFSRILKVVLTDSSNIQEMLSSQAASIRSPTSLLSRPSSRGRFFRNAHNSPGFASVRAAYVTPTKLQWKRDSTATGGSPSLGNGLKPAGQGTSMRPGVKSFTYIRNQSAQQ